MLTIKGNRLVYQMESDILLTWNAASKLVTDRRRPKKTKSLESIY